MRDLGIRKNRSFCFRGSKGFTLVEVMITMVIAALVLLVLTSGSGFIIRQWSREKSSLDRSLDGALFLLRLERAMAGAFPHLYVKKEGKGKQEKDIFFEGNENSVSWVSTVAPGGIHGLAAWRITEDEGDTLIYLVPAGADNPEERLEAAEPVARMPGLSFTVQYLDERDTVPGSDVERKWEDKWSGAKKKILPAAVLFTFSRKEHQEAPTPLLVPLRARKLEQLAPAGG